MFVGQSGRSARARANACISCNNAYGKGILGVKRVRYLLRHASTCGRVWKEIRDERAFVRFSLFRCCLNGTGRVCFLIIEDRARIYQYLIIHGIAINDNDNFRKLQSV